MRFRANTFLVAGNAIQSSALLLRSADRWQRTGLGNSHDMVGRGLCMKLSRYCYAEIPGLAAAAPHRGPFSTFAVMDFYLNGDCPAGLGGVVYENHLEQMESASSALLEVLLADTPRMRNRVYLSNVTDHCGIPRIVIDYETAPTDTRRLDWVTARASELLYDAGARDVKRVESMYEHGSCHLHGGCRAGRDPRTSVVDPDGRVHGVDNLYVIDGGYMPSPTGVNPTLTIQSTAYKLVSQMIGDSAVPMTC
jgi:paromamine 6'-oxidase/6'''-hydroxyneomycin C oxidase/2'-deamino-2'-hydroxyparomamine 6'-oxidase